MKTINSWRNREAITEKGRLLIGYLLAGYPSREDSFLQIQNCDIAGLDVFEIGYPASDPASDGEVIRRAHRLVDSGISQDLDYWKRLRAATEKPIWVMGYQKDLVESGFYRKLAKNGIADAFVVPDMTFEQHIALAKEAANDQVDVLGFVNPRMDEEEQERCFAEFALVYHQLYAGPTGMAGTSEDFRATLARAHTHAHVHSFAGFGISTPERIAELLESGFDGTIVGTAMIKKLNNSLDELTAFVRQLAKPVREAENL